MFGMGALQGKHLSTEQYKDLRIVNCPVAGLKVSSYQLQMLGK